MDILALVDAPDHVCCRYRIRAFAPALTASGARLTIAALAASPLQRLAQFHRASRFDSVILQRKLLPAWQLWTLRRHAQRLVFDFDDAVLYRDSYDRRGPYCRRRAARFARTVRLADAVIAGNAFLAGLAVDAGARPRCVHVIPTCIDPTRYPVAAHRPRPVGTLELVWVGSSSTLQGLELQRSLWKRLGRALPGVRLRVVADRVPSDFDPLPIVAVPWRAATEAEEIARADVGITWVPDDLWSRGKCGLKLLQYQAAGLPVVANPVGVHAEMITAGVSGLLAQTPDDWVEAIRALANDPELRRRLGASARASVEASYAVPVWTSEFATAATGRDADAPEALDPSPRAADWERSRCLAPV